MYHHNIDILIVQETYCGEDSKDNIIKYLWHHPKEENERVHHRGLGIGTIIEFTNYTSDTEATDERLMVMTLRGHTDIHIVAAHAPTAAATEKDTFYSTPQTAIHKRKKRRMVIIGADMTSKFVETSIAQGDGISHDMFGEGQTLEEGAGVEVNRSRLQELPAQHNL